MFMIDANDLILLVKIMEAGNLSKAAKQMKTSRANISFKLNKLEQSIGQQLFRRNTRNLEATETALQLYQYGKNIKEELLAAKETLISFQQGIQGKIRLSVPTGFGAFVMSDLLIEFKKTYPHIILDVTFDNKINNLLDKGIDIAIRVISDPPENLVARVLGSVHYVACASDQYLKQYGIPIDITELSDLPIITSEAVGKKLKLTGYKDNLKSEVFLEPTIRSDNYPFLKQMILAGLGIGLVPRYIMQDALASKQVCSLFDSYRLSIFGSTMYLLYMPNLYRTKASQELIDFIIEKIRNQF